MQKKPKTHLHDGAWGTLCNAQPVPAWRIVSHFRVQRSDGTFEFTVSGRRQCVLCTRIALTQGRPLVLDPQTQRELRRAQRRRR